VGLDTETFKTALKYVLRQDPDIILIGEMRDVETVQAAITAAETGHLVLSTLHTMDTIQTMERILDFFPPNQQNQVRVQLSNTLRAVISQRLVQRAGGVGVVPAAEIMIVTPTIKSLIADNKITSIRQFIARGQSHTACRPSTITHQFGGRRQPLHEGSRHGGGHFPERDRVGLKGISSSRPPPNPSSARGESQQKERMGGWLKRAQDLFQRNRSRTLGRAQARSPRDAGP
jgi:hypothetical protein